MILENLSFLEWTFTKSLKAVMSFGLLDFLFRWIDKLSWWLVSSKELLEIRCPDPAVMVEGVS